MLKRAEDADHHDGRTGDDAGGGLDAARVATVATSGEENSETQNEGGVIAQISTARQSVRFSTECGNPQLNEMQSPWLITYTSPSRWMTADPSTHRTTSSPAVGCQTRVALRNEAVYRRFQALAPTGSRRSTSQFFGVIQPREQP